MAFLWWGQASRLPYPCPINSHGWSAARRQPGEAQPVDSITSLSIPPRGEKCPNEVRAMRGAFRLPARTAGARSLPDAQHLESPITNLLAHEMGERPLPAPPSPMGELLSEARLRGPAPPNPAAYHGHPARASTFPPAKRAQVACHRACPVVSTPFPAFKPAKQAQASLSPCASSDPSDSLASLHRRPTSPHRACCPDPTARPNLRKGVRGKLPPHWLRARSASDVAGISPAIHHAQ